MKANEAPEKIYLQKYDTNTFLCLNRYNIHEEWTERPICANSATGNDIEYTRTDAFIEKACEFLDGCIPDYIDLKHANVDTFMDVDNKRFIEDFRKYMKVE